MNVVSVSRCREASGKPRTGGRFCTPVVNGSHTPAANRCHPLARSAAAAFVLLLGVAVCSGSAQAQQSVIRRAEPADSFCLYHVQATQCGDPGYTICINCPRNGECPDTPGFKEVDQEGREVCNGRWKLEKKKCKRKCGSRRNPGQSGYEFVTP